MFFSLSIILGIVFFFSRFQSITKKLWFQINSWGFRIIKIQDNSFNVVYNIFGFEKGKVPEKSDEKVVYVHDCIIHLSNVVFYQFFSIFCFIIWYGVMFKRRWFSVNHQDRLFIWYVMLTSMNNHSPFFLVSMKSKKLMVIRQKHFIISLMCCYMSMLPFSIL